MGGVDSTELAGQRDVGGVQTLLLSGAQWAAPWRRADWALHAGICPAQEAELWGPAGLGDSIASDQCRELAADACSVPSSVLGPLEVTSLR